MEYYLIQKWTGIKEQYDEDEMMQNLRAILSDSEWLAKTNNTVFDGPSAEKYWSFTEDWMKASKITNSAQLKEFPTLRQKAKEVEENTQCLRLNAAEEYFKKTLKGFNPIVTRHYIARYMDYSDPVYCIYDKQVTENNLPKKGFAAGTIEDIRRDLVRRGSITAMATIDQLVGFVQCNHLPWSIFQVHSDDAGCDVTRDKLL